MSNKNETITLTITASVSMMARIRRLLGLLEYCCAVGHSTYVGTWVDGDGPDKVDIQVNNSSARLYETYGKEIADMEYGRGQRLDLNGSFEMVHDNSYSLSRFVNTKK